MIHPRACGSGVEFEVQFISRVKDSVIGLDCLFFFEIGLNDNS